MLKGNVVWKRLSPQKSGLTAGKVQTQVVDEKAFTFVFQKHQRARLK